MLALQQFKHEMGEFWYRNDLLGHVSFHGVYTAS